MKIERVILADIIHVWGFSAPVSAPVWTNGYWVQIFLAGRVD
jgi:hypothetical protein